MNRTLLIAATAIALSAPAVPHAHAASPTWMDVKGKIIRLSGVRTADLVKNCQGNTMEYPCAGFILGVSDALVLTGKLCPPDVSELHTQILAVAVKYLNSNPEKWAQPPAALIGDALAPVFPCDNPAGQ